ncbi:histidine phosphatase family protein [Microlunatus sp. Y2014]|uniref:histidine phosphatase family protein n=1 Tax=Microlunatus sp. Y2014 TaxID=3418488 RepID=UPI003DA7719C
MSDHSTTAGTDPRPDSRTGATRFILLRHGRTAWNAAGRFQGQADIPLDDVGEQQAQAAADVLVDERIDTIWASDLVRAHATALAVGERHGLPVRTDRQLREIHVGSWEGMTSAEVAELDPSYGERYARGEDVRRSPTGETSSEVGTRVAARLREIAAAEPSGSTVLVGIHGHAAYAGSAALLGMPYEQWKLLGPLSNCHWVDLQRGPSGAWRIAGWNVGPTGMPDGERPVRPGERILSARG